MPEIKSSDILLLINPNSGKKNAEQLIKNLENFDEQVDYVVTKNLQHLKETFEKEIDNYKVFVAVGGDGSINESMKYLLTYPDKYLAVYPNGSGNGFARELGFEADLKRLIAEIHKGEYIEMDILNINERTSINALGVGLDSYVAHEFDKTEGRGFANYILLSLKALFTFKPISAVVKADGVERSGTFMMVTVANTRQYGNNAIIAPEAKPNDGVFDVVLVRPFPFYMYPYFATQLFSGTLKPNKYIEFVKSRQIEIETDFVKFHVDGEPVTFSNGVKITRNANKIRVIKTSRSRV